MLKPGDGKRVVVGMSGGVDSSVAAALLVKKGFQVIGITMCFNLPESSGRRPNCCGRQGIEDARRVAHKLGIRHYVLNMQKALSEKVIKNFCQEYLRGRTPNPCVRCNQYLKFGLLLEKAIFLGASHLATGHYSRIIKTKEGYSLAKAGDLSKDQSYFLYRLGQKQLKYILFPLAGYKKEEVRHLAKEFGLAVAAKPGSQEICFLPDQKDYRPFLEKQSRGRIKRGKIVDKEGNILGEHKGIPFYTIGQRQGLGLAMGYPAYITRIDYRSNQITIGAKDEACGREFLIREPHFAAGSPKKKVALLVKIRYNHKEAPAYIERSGRVFKVRFLRPQFAITPGQSAVFYSRSIIVGGGIIDRVLN
ncbi:MAG: tRNA 2-thiouridine(34) synthase MnmA [bacterium]